MKNNKSFTKFLSVICVIAIVVTLCSCGNNLSQNIESNWTNTIVSNTSNNEASSNKQDISNIQSPSQNTSNNLEATIHSDLIVHFIDVGQGDSVYIELPNGQNMLIDAGGDYDGNPVVDYLNSLNINRITYLVATHPHADHINYMADVVNTYAIDNIYMPNITTTTKTFEKLLNAINSKNERINIVKAGYTILDTGELDILVFGPTKDSYEDLNGYSIIIKIVYKNNSMIFMGDAEKENEDVLTDNIDVDLVKVGHHGSGTSSSTTFVNKTSADFAIISVGNDNSYGHPHENIVERWVNSGAQVYATMNCGTIKAISNGSEINISHSKKQASDTESESDTINNTQYNWVLNTNSKKIHKNNCKYAEQILEANKALSNKSIHELTREGYSCCGSCKPTE